MAANSAARRTFRAQRLPVDIATLLGKTHEEESLRLVETRFAKKGTLEIGEKKAKSNGWL
jgi:hypothetical protein